MADVFVLTEKERVTTASRYRDGVLICRPFGVVRWENVVLVVFALFVSGSLVAAVSEDSDPMSITLAVVFASTLVGASVVWAVVFARSHVRADVDGLMIRDRLRNHRYGWDQIEGFDVIEQNAPLRWLPNLTAGFTWHIWPNEAIPIVRLRNRTQRRLLLLASTQRSAPGRRRHSAAIRECGAAGSRRGMLQRCYTNGATRVGFVVEVYRLGLFGRVVM